MHKSPKLIHAKCPVNFNYLAQPHPIVHFNDYQGFSSGVYAFFSIFWAIKLITRSRKWDKWGCFENTIGSGNERYFQVVNSYLPYFPEVTNTALKFDTSDRFACMIHHWKGKNFLFPTMCCNINLVKPFGNCTLLNTGSTAKNLSA